MANIVFILGAGASAQGGCPVMNTFFREAERLHEHEALGRFGGDFEAIEDVRRFLFNRQTKMQFNINNMERVFNALEMGRTLGTV